jgi:hypothetical protein
MKRKQPDLPESEWAFGDLNSDDWAPACHWEYIREMYRKYPHGRPLVPWLELTPEKRKELVRDGHFGKTYSAPALFEAQKISNPGSVGPSEGKMKTTRRKVTPSESQRLTLSGFVHYGYKFAINWAAPKEDILNDFSDWLDRTDKKMQGLHKFRGKKQDFRAWLIDLVLYRFAENGFSCREAEKALTQPGNEWIITKRSTAFTKSRFSEAKKRVARRLLRHVQLSQLSGAVKGS